MIAFIDDHRAAYGLEPRSGSRPICKVLPIAPSSYYDHAAKRANPKTRSDRAKRDTALQADIQRVFAENFAV
jgi:putative transposase